MERKKYEVELITAESEASRFVRHRRHIRFPQLTMPLLAVNTPSNWEVTHTDKIVRKIDFNKKVDLVGITANTAVLGVRWTNHWEENRWNENCKNRWSKIYLFGSFVRYWIWMIGVAMLGVGYFWIPWQKNKQGWNDLAAKTYVVKV